MCTQFLITAEGAKRPKPCRGVSVLNLSLCSSTLNVKKERHSTVVLGAVKCFKSLFWFGFTRFPLGPSPLDSPCLVGTSRTRRCAVWLRFHQNPAFTITCYSLSAQRLENILNSRKLSALLIVAGVVIVAGSVPLPQNLMEITDHTGQVAPRLVLLRIAQFAPFFPLVCGIVRLTTRFRLSRAWATVLACIILCIGMLFTLIGAGLSGPGFMLMLLQGSANSLSVASSLILLVGQPSPHLRTKFAVVGLAIAVAASVWSLQTVYAVAKQAKISQTARLSALHTIATVHLLKVSLSCGVSVFTRQQPATKVARRSISTDCWWFRRTERDTTTGRREVSVLI